ncbi:MAG: hypothetical protein NUW10_04810 [candidate division WOR-3 bacterium]|nr:hypothetical protein [candidate division WOR-3 bacterium]
MGCEVAELWFCHQTQTIEDWVAFIAGSLWDGCEWLRCEGEGGGVSH